MMRIVTLLIGILVGLVAQANNTLDAHEWLAKMLQAASQQSYQGIIVTGNQQRWDSYQIRHAQVNGEEYEWIEQLTDQPKVAIRHQNSIFCGHSETLHSHHRPLQNPLRPQAELLINEQAYQLQLGKSKRVAGRWAQQIQIQPQDEYRYAVNLWLDLETALLLKTEIVSAKEVLVRAQFAQIDYDTAFTNESFVSNIAGHSLLVLPKERSSENLSEWQPQWLPDGFELNMAQQQADGSVRLLYFDGITSFSVFLEDIEQESAAIEKRWSATTAVVLTVTEGTQVKKVTAVGEVPAQALKKVARSMAINKGK